MALPAPTLTADTARWFRRQARTVAPRVRLVCFPHAGGAASLYRDWSDGLPSGIEVLAARLPARQDRFREPPVEHMDELADRIAEALRPLLDLPYAFFGHSLGADVAYEVARRLEREHAGSPERIFVSGAPAPHISEPVDVDSYDDPALVAEIQRLGAPHTELLDDPELAALLLPSLRADYRLSARYRPTLAELDPVRAPITALVGDADPLVPVEDALQWSRLTTGGFNHRVYPGDHFYLERHRKALLRLVQAVLLPA
ncbi:thioesterase II family protein [Streptomyces sp. NBC_00091]|uniref:thioesterase II family protein n=1 Tax=Streptomyces sp. NBC_00091 TaxID=2975648 RepID=UPI002256C965|nr:thioesterase domain-containing protein [Streptomyces sp. NBC_00091]MCX5375321.1 thioesterase domain-containing protein [Streptomyces sp. NBC_00091]